MNCRRAQTEIALWAGDDVDETGCPGLRHHLKVCPACRDYHEQMRALLRLVDECPLRDETDEASQRAVEESLWPALSARLISRPSRQYDHFNGWVPAVAVAAVCLVMVLVASPPPSLSPQETQPVSVMSEDKHPKESRSRQESAPIPKHRLAPPIESMPADFSTRQPSSSDVLWNDFWDDSAPLVPSRDLPTRGHND